MEHHVTPKAGFTLLELLLYVAVSATVVGTVSFMSIQVLQARVRQQIIAEVNEQSNYVVHTVLDEIENAEAINSPVNTTATSLSVNAPGASNDPTVYDLSGGRITKTTPSGTVNLTSTRIVVTSLSFQDRAAVGQPGSITVTFTATYNGGTASIANYGYSQNFDGTTTVRR